MFKTLIILCCSGPMIHSILYYFTHKCFIYPVFNSFHVNKVSRQYTQHFKYCISFLCLEYRLPQTTQLKTTEICFLIVVQLTSPKSALAELLHFFSPRIWVESIPCLSPSFWWLVIILDLPCLSLQYSNLSPSSYCLLLCLYLILSCLMRIFVNGFKALPDN